MWNYNSCNSRIIIAAIGVGLLNKGGICMTKIMTCSCIHEYQDKQYGKGKRLFNSIKSLHQPMWRCTVCGKEKG